MECRKNRSDTRFYVPRLCDVWPLPLQQLEQYWDEVYVDEFPEVSDSFARPGDVRWDTLYTVFTKRWLMHLSPYLKTALWRLDITASASPLPVGGGVSREPSLGRPLARRKLAPAEVLVAPRPEPVRCEARIRTPSRRHLISPIVPQKEVVAKPPAPPEPGNELAQLQRLLTLCSKGSWGHAILDPREQSACCDGVGVDPAVTARFSGRCLFVV